ncbi:MAG TPA: hypothetical protein VGR28_10955 [Candidatus Thermoplasmatota archaeon]|jgi:uncharacterized protein (DUF1697 family)|nr:hypothetical protein [Candidatus Thermoplasmatota archaeon]
MALVVFLRGVNLGRKRFQPSVLAKDLADLEVASLGAAGTFIVRGSSDARKVRAAFGAALPFEAEVMAVKAADVRELVEARPFGRVPTGARPFVSVLGAVPRTLPTFPVERPASGAWEVRLVGVRGPFALSVRRNQQGRFYPNELVEATLGVPATTRGWATIEALAKKLG